MSKKKQESKITNQETKVLEVEVIIPEESMDSELAKHYNKPDEKLVYEIGENFTDEFVEKLKAITDNLNINQLTLYNPLVSILKDLDEIKTLQPTGDDKKDDKLYKEANKFIRSFNGTNKNAKDTLKRPLLDFAQQFQDVYNLLDNESKITRSALNENFKEYLEKKAEEKRKKEEAAKEAELKRIKELEESNREANEKAKNQELLNNALKVENALKDIMVNATKDVDSLNLEGLNQRKSQLEANGFELYFEKKATVLPEFEISQYDDDKISEFRKIFEGQIVQTIRFIDTIIQGKIVEQEKQEAAIAEKAKQEAIQNTPVPPPPAEIEDDEEDVILDENGKIKEEYLETISDKEMCEFLLTHFKELKNEFEYYHKIASSYVPKNEETDVYGVMLGHFKESIFPTKWMQENIDYIESQIEEYKK